MILFVIVLLSCLIGQNIFIIFFSHFSDNGAGIFVSARPVGPWQDVVILEEILGSINVPYRQFFTQELHGWLC